MIPSNSPVYPQSFLFTEADPAVVYSPTFPTPPWSPAVEGEAPNALPPFLQLVDWAASAPRALENIPSVVQVAQRTIQNAEPDALPSFLELTDWAAAAPQNETPNTLPPFLQLMPEMMGTRVPAAAGVGIPEERSTKRARGVVVNAPEQVQVESLQFMWITDPYKAKTITIYKLASNNKYVPSLLNKATIFEKNLLRWCENGSSVAGEMGFSIIFNGALEAARKISNGLCYCASDVMCGSSKNCDTLTALFGVPPSNLEKPVEDIINITVAMRAESKVDEHPQPIIDAELLRNLWRRKPDTAPYFVNSRLYFHNENVPILLGKALALQKNFQKVMPVQNTKLPRSVSFYAALSAARQIFGGPCYCAASNCTMADCKTFVSFFGISETRIKGIVDLVLYATYRTSNRIKAREVHEQVTNGVPNPTPIELPAED